MIDARMLRIDAHTHVFPEEVVSNRVGFLGRDPWFENLFSNPKSLLVTVESLIESMRDSGIAHSVVCGFPGVMRGCVICTMTICGTRSRDFPHT